MKSVSMILFLPALVALASCRPADVPLPPGAVEQAANARQATFPRPTQGALPVADGEVEFDGCGIEHLQGAVVGEVAADGTLVADQPARMRGWTFPPRDVPGIPDAWLRLLPLETEGAAVQIPLVASIARPDVAKGRSTRLADYSGFAGVMIDGLPPGRYRAQVVYASPAGRWTCRNARDVLLK